MALVNWRENRTEQKENNKIQSVNIHFNEIQTQQWICAFSLDEAIKSELEIYFLMGANKINGLSQWIQYFE